jgi:hypothetical protein
LVPKSKAPFPPPPGAGAPAKLPPPFPVVAPPKTGKTMPPIPHIAVSGEVAEVEVPKPRERIPFWKKTIVQIGALAALLIVGGVGYFLSSRPPPPPPVVVKPKPAAPTTPAAAATTPANAAVVANKPAVQPTPGLSETQNAIAHAPVNAINKANDVIAKRVGSGQGRDAVGAITDGDAAVSPGDKPAKPAGPQTFATSTAIAPGVSATNDNVSAAAEASPAFRSFVANAKIGGVFQGNPPRLLINGRTVRGGDTVDNGLSITFDSVDSDKKMILFKDKAGAVVTRRY